jgi:hypothetical protein
MILRGKKDMIDQISATAVEGTLFGSGQSKSTIRPQSGHLDPPAELTYRSASDI